MLVMRGKQNSVRIQFLKTEPSKKFTSVETVFTACNPPLK